MSTYDRRYDNISFEDIRACEDIYDLLEYRADALQAMHDIELQIEADNTMPRPDTAWQQRARGAMQFRAAVARTASGRLIEIAPEELAAEIRSHQPSQADLYADIERLTRDGERAAWIISEKNETIARLEARVASQADTLTALHANATSRTERAELHRISLEAAERRRTQKMEAQQARDEAAGQRFIDAAKRILPTEQYHDLWRAAGRDEKPTLTVVAS